MRVLHVVSAPTGGGADHQLRLLVRHLPHDCEVVTLSPPEPGTGFATVGRLIRLIRRERFDVVHTHLYRACVPGRLAAWLAGAPHVVATEQHLDPDRRSAPGRALYRVGELHSRVTIAASTAVAGRLCEWGVPRARITVIPKAVDAAEFRFDPALRAAARARLRLPSDTPVIGGVGRLEPGKRFDRLIRAVGEVPGAALLLVGDGPARVALERLAVIEGVADRVLFAGAVEHTREMLCAMDVMASPARDTFGLVALEAIAAGLPALYATCVPLDELGAAGTTVAGTRRLTPRDPESLPRALRTELLCLAERHGARLPARTAGGRCDANQVAASVGRLYERLAGRAWRLGRLRRSARPSRPAAPRPG